MHSLTFIALTELPTTYPTWDKVGLYLFGITLFLAINAFFVAIEFSLIKIRKSQLIEIQGKRPKRVALALHAVARLEGYLSAGQLGITVASLVLGMLGEPLVESLVAPFLQHHTSLSGGVIKTISYIIAAVSFSLVHVVIGEQVPKVFAIRKPVVTTLFLIRPLHLFFRTFGWAIWVINSSANLILKRVFKLDPVGHAAVHSAEEIAQLVEESQKHDEVTETERKILIRALDLNDLQAKDIMTPRRKTVVLDIDDDLDEILKTAIKSKHTRFPLVKGHLDNSQGFVHIKDLLALVQKKSTNITRIKRKLEMVPETMALDTLLKFFLKKHTPLALVMDEFGDPVGLVFLDDVLAEIVGDIHDEFDEVHSQFTRVSDREFLVEGSLTLNELSNYVPELELESDEVTTVGGYVIGLLGRFPEPEESLEIESFTARVTNTDGRRIRQIQFKKTETSEENHSAKTPSPTPKSS